MSEIFDEFILEFGLGKLLKMREFLHLIDQGCQGVSGGHMDGNDIAGDFEVNVIHEPILFLIYI